MAEIGRTDIPERYEGFGTGLERFAEIRLEELGDAWVRKGVPLSTDASAATTIYCYESDRSVLVVGALEEFTKVEMTFMSERFEMTLADDI